MKRKNKLPPWLQPTKLHVGVGWYTAEEWAKVKSSAADAERFEATFPEWEAMAEQALVDLRIEGIDAKKSSLLPVSFWPGAW